MNTASFQKALHVLKALLDNVSLNQSQGTPIIVQATLITKYCPTAILPNQGPNPYTPSVPRHQNHSPTTSGISNSVNPFTHKSLLLSRLIGDINSPDGDIDHSRILYSCYAS